MFSKIYYCYGERTFLTFSVVQKEKKRTLIAVRFGDHGPLDRIWLIHLVFHCFFHLRRESRASNFKMKKCDIFLDNDHF